MNNLYEIHNFVRFIEYFTFNTFFWRVGMKFQTKLIATCILLASSSYSLAENADGGRDAAALATTNDLKYAINWPTGTSVILTTYS